MKNLFNRKKRIIVSKLYQSFILLKDKETDKFILDEGFPICILITFKTLEELAEKTSKILEESGYKSDEVSIYIVPKTESPGPSYKVSYS